jgi:hypothetical protein
LMKSEVICFAFIQENAMQPVRAIVKCCLTA